MPQVHQRHAARTSKFPAADLKVPRRGLQRRIVSPAECGNASCTQTFELGDSLLDQPRTLIILQKGQSQWGMGNLLPILLSYHTLCFYFRRKCVIRMMNAGFERFFRYQNGRSQRGNLTRTRVDKELGQRGGALVKALQEHNASAVIRLSLKHLPDFTLEPSVEQLKLPPPLRRPCILRWFAEPVHAPVAPKSEFDRALHLRTDWADLSSEQRRYGSYNGTVSMQWLLHACPNLTSWGEDDLVVSDSPGILKSARALGIQVGSAVTLLGRTHSAGSLATTKGVAFHNSTESIVEASITDLHWLMRSRVVYSGGSSFTRPAQLGSLCADFRSLRHICPNYPHVFPREFHKILPPGRHQSMYAAASRSIQSPCHNLSSVKCLAQYVQAVASE